MKLLRDTLVLFIQKVAKRSLFFVVAQKRNHSIRLDNNDVLSDEKDLSLDFFVFHVFPLEQVIILKFYDWANETGDQRTGQRARSSVLPISVYRCNYAI